MLINLRNALMSGKRLPYDAEVEYVTNLSGRATITTDIYHNTANKLEFGVMLPPVSGGQYLGTFRAYSNEQTATTRVIRNAANTGSILVNHGTIAGGGGTTMSVSNADTVLWGWTKAGEANINGVSATLFQPAVQTLSVPFEFFYTQTAGRIYHFKVENQCDLIPVRKNGAGYLYDRMSGKMYGPDSGVLSYGPDVVPVEYIESHAAEYIDTGAIPDDSTGIEVVHTICTDNEKDNIIFGARQDSGNTRYWSDIDWGANDSIGWGFNTYSGNNERFILAASDAGRIITNSLNFMNDRAGKIDGVTYDSSLQNKTLATFSRSIYLFGANNQGTVGIRGKFKVFSTKISKGQTLAKKFIPVRVGTDATSWEGAMMDVLTRRIYRNAGTGAFGYGNDLKYPIPAE